MAALYTSYNWLTQGNSKSDIWTKEENKEFERALAIVDEKTPDRWLKVTAMIPGKSVWDVITQYKKLIEDVSEIEAGLVPLPGYLTAPFTLEWVENTSFDPLGLGKRSSSASLARPSEHERKKGVPWTEDEHRRFLLGLQKYGKGDWRNISRNFVITKTPTQVASHAQKYFLRQNSGGKDKRRPSIHDITTANVTDALPILSETSEKSINFMPKMLLDWSNSSGEPFMVFNSGQKLCSYQGAYVGSN